MPNTTLQDAADFLARYFEAYFEHRDLSATLACFSEGFSVIGSGRDELAWERASASELYARDLAQAPGPIHFRQEASRLRELGPSLVLAEITGTLSTLVVGQPWLAEVRMSLVLNRVGGRWGIEHKHISLPHVEQDPGEAFPLRELEARNRLLESLVAERTAELEARNRQLGEALARVRTLRGLVPICAWCKKVRDDAGFWHQVEAYLARTTEADFTHGVCPDCAKDMRPLQP